MKRQILLRQVGQKSNLKEGNGIARDALSTVLIVLLVQVILIIKLRVFDGNLAGPDVYMWLVRVLDLYETGNWFDSSLERINPPDGFVQHWTRPFDVLLFLGALAGSLFMGFETALYGWAVFISPVLEILAVFALFWAFSPILGKRSTEVLGLLFITQLGILVTYTVGRADHQSFLSTLFVVSLGLGVRVLLYPFSYRWCYLFGITSAIMLWVSMEAILVVLVNLTALTFFWLIVREDFSRKLVHYTLSLFLCAFVALLLERGVNSFFTPEFDRISIVLIFLLGLICGYWGIAHLLEERLGLLADRRRRFGLVTLGALLIAFLVESFSPGFLAGPMSNVDELFQKVHMARVSELQPLVLIPQISAGNWGEQFVRFIFWAGILLPGVPAIMYLLALSESPEVRCWTYLAIGVVVFGSLLVSYLRLVFYVSILLLPAYAWLVGGILHRVDAHIAAPKASILRLALLVVAAGWFVIPVLVMSLLEDKADDRIESECPLVPVSRYLDDPDGWGAARKNVVAFTDFGPELLYRTKHAVFAIPNHRHQRGFTDIYQMLTASDEGVARDIAERRRVHLILICPAGVERTYYKNETGGQTLHYRLSGGETPPWLKEILLPDELATDFKLFEVQLTSDMHTAATRERPRPCTRLPSDSPVPVSLCHETGEPTQTYVSVKVSTSTKAGTRDRDVREGTFYVP